MLDEKGLLTGAVMGLFTVAAVGCVVDSFGLLTGGVFAGCIIGVGSVVGTADLFTGASVDVVGTGCIWRFCLALTFGFCPVARLPFAIGLSAGMLGCATVCCAAAMLASGESIVFAVLGTVGVLVMGVGVKDGVCDTLVCIPDSFFCPCSNLGDSADNGLGLIAGASVSGAC